MKNHQLPLPNAKAYLFPHYEQHTQQTFEYLASHLKWSTYDDASGRRYCNMGMDYLFDGQLYHGEPIDPVVHKIMQRLNRQFNVQMNSCHAHYYHDGHTVLPYKQELGTQVDITQPIFVLSFGGSRYFSFRNNQTLEEYDFLVQDGDLLIMSENCQQQYLHGVRQSAFLTEPRIGIAFRQFHSWITD